MNWRKFWKFIASCVTALAIFAAAFSDGRLTLGEGWLLAGAIVGALAVFAVADE